MSSPTLSRILQPAAVAIAALLCTLTLAPPVAGSSGPTLVKNINQSGSSNPSYLTKVGSTLFFAANDGIHGTELWKSDGTAAGTKMVKNIRPYAKGSFPHDLTNVNGTLYFTANDGVHGRELWKSNGTSAGTVMVKDFLCSEFACNALRSPVAVGSRLFFFVTWCCVSEGSLIVSDGTAAGTHEVKGWLPMGIIGSARALASKLFFVRYDYTVEPAQARLWVSNGTQAGTHVVNGSPTADGMAILPATGAFLYFATYRLVNEQPAQPIQLWRTDGTAAGTVALTTAGGLPEVPSAAVYLNHAIYFISQGDYTPPSGLWRTDGTAAGTWLVKGGNFNQLVTAGGRLYLSDGGRLWRSDGTTAGTKEVGSFDDSLNLTAVGTYLCFAGVNTFEDEWRLWVSNGTSAGTHQVRTWPNHGAMSTRAVVGSRLYFVANDGTRGNELWRYTP